MLKRNYLKEKLESGKTVLGTWCIVPSPVLTDIICQSGIDFVIIDAEHGPISFETAQLMSMAAESSHVSPVMRVGGVVESEILRSLDIGVHCVQVPNVYTKEQVEEIVAYAKYPPLGNRGFSPFTRAGGYHKSSAIELPSRANQNTMVAINVEGKEAIDNIDGILEIEGLDIVFIGLFDLSKAMGIPGQVDNPELLDKLKFLAEKVIMAGKFPGTITTSNESIHDFIEIGLRYIVHQVDCHVILDSFKQIKTCFDEAVNLVSR